MMQQGATVIARVHIKNHGVTVTAPRLLGAARIKLVRLASVRAKVLAFLPGAVSEGSTYCWNHALPPAAGANPALVRYA